MSNRLVPLALLVLLVILHAQLWVGRGSVPHVSDMTRQLAAEVRDLKEGLEMVEEKARLELGMVKPNEILVQITQQKPSAATSR